MSEETAFSINEIVLYIPLLNEGIDGVLRPTTAILLQPGVARVLATPNYNPNDEEWEFPPGSIVQFVEEHREGREILVARHRIS